VKKQFAKRGYRTHSSGMNTETIEQKLAELTNRVERLEEKVKPVAKPNWREAIGTAKGDALDREAARLGAEWRANEGAVQ
jgi:uncharacterized protein (UPF0335 family)